MICLELYISNSFQLDKFLKDPQERAKHLSVEEILEVLTETSSKLRERIQRSLCSDL